MNDSWPKCAAMWIRWSKVWLCETKSKWVSGKQWQFTNAIYKVSRACTADFFWKKNKWMKSVIVCVAPNRSCRLTWSAGWLKPPGVWISVQSAEEDPGGHSGSFLLPMSPRYNCLGLRNLFHCTRSTKINNSGPRHYTFSSAPAQNEGVNNTPRGDLENHIHSHAHIYGCMWFV